MVNYSPIFYETKIVGALSLLLLVLLLIMMCVRKSKNNTIIYHIKIELIISSIIYTIGFILPTKKAENDQVQVYEILCKVQTFLLSFTNMTTIAFTVTIPTITYKLLVDPSYIEQNLTMILSVISGICWGFGMILSIIYFIHSEKEFSVYNCWYEKKAIIYISNGINIGVLLIFVFVLYKLKRNIQQLIKENQIEFPESYLHIFKVFILMVVFSFITVLFDLAIELHNETYLENFDWVFGIGSYLDCFFYLLNSYVFCFKKEMLPSCSIPQNDKEKIPITDNLSLIIMNFEGK